MNHTQFLLLLGAVAVLCLAILLYGKDYRRP